MQLIYDRACQTQVWYGACMHVTEEVWDVIFGIGPLEAGDLEPSAETLGRCSDLVVGFRVHESLLRSSHAMLGYNPFAVV
jgi:hypothetical protein